MAYRADESGIAKRASVTARRKRGKKPDREERFEGRHPWHSMVGDLACVDRDAERLRDPQLAADRRSDVAPTMVGEDTLLGLVGIGSSYHPQASGREQFVPGKILGPSRAVEISGDSADDFQVLDNELVSVQGVVQGATR
jgi:hypothetical protein